MAEETYDPFAFSDVGRRALEGEYIDSMRFFWFDPVTGEEGQTTEGYSRVPDSAKPYIYLNPNERNAARDKFYSSGAGFGGTNLAGGQGIGGGLLSGQAYAQQIAGGIPFEQVVAPGMSFSPDQPMGFLAEGATPTQQETTFFPSVSDSNAGMTGTDLGLPMGTGTPMPAGTLFDETSVTSMPATFDVKDVAGSLAAGLVPTKADILKVYTPLIFGSPRPDGKFLPNVYESYENAKLLEAAGYPQLIEGKIFPLTNPLDVELAPIEPPLPATTSPVTTTTPVATTSPVTTGGGTGTGAAPIVALQEPIVAQVAKDLGIPINLGFPTLSVPISEREPVIPTMPVMTNFTVPQNPILNVENIISPIRTGGTRRLLGTL